MAEPQRETRSPALAVVRDRRNLAEEDLEAVAAALGQTLARFRW